MGWTSRSQAGGRRTLEERRKLNPGPACACRPDGAWLCAQGTRAPPSLASVASVAGTVPRCVLALRSSEAVLCTACWSSHGEGHLQATPVLGVTPGQATALCSDRECAKPPQTPPV